MTRYIHRLYALLPAMLLALVGTSCADDLEPEPVAAAAPDSITLTLKLPKEAVTRAAKTETELNEFKVSTVHFYFYKSAGHNDASDASVYDVIMPANFDTKGTVTVALPSNALEADGLFGTDLAGAKCIVYAVANTDETLFPEGTAKTIDELKAASISSTFDQSVIQDSFAMDGQAEVTLTDADARIATGEIELERAAAKITLCVNLPEQITVTTTLGDGSKVEEVYYSQADNMHVWMGNGVMQSPLNTQPREAAAEELYSNDLQATEGKGSKFVYDENMVTYKYVQDIPFYSYPNKWDAATPDGNTHLTIVLPWHKKDAAGNITETTVTYYTLAVQPKVCEIRRNMHYDMRVSISRLGSIEPQTPINMDVDWNYEIPWNTQTLETDIKAIRYLLLNNNYYDSTVDFKTFNEQTGEFENAKGAYTFEMNNTTEIEIPVATSHDVKIASVTMSWLDYSSKTVAQRSITLTPDGGTFKYNSIKDSYNSTTDFAGIEVDNSTSKLKLKRDMLHISGEPEWVKGHYEGFWDRVWVDGYWENGSIDITENAALNTYTFDITLQHVDDASQTAKVHITQYPPIYITSQYTTSKDYRFVNGQNSDGSVSNGLGSLSTENTQNNYNTYIITISRFNKNANYIIGDPRVRSVNNLSSNGNWANTDSKGNNLTYYYPTDDNSGKTRYIAPKIRIASQRAITTDVTKEGALRRCASYQENGRPAGRWRVPTVAEVEYIAYLSCNKYIPYIFGNTNHTGDNAADYWCASGKVYVDNNQTNPSVTEKNTEGNSSVRCVYDEWYWGTDTLEDADKGKFVWGDKKRTVNGN